MIHHAALDLREPFCLERVRTASGSDRIKWVKGLGCWVLGVDVGWSGQASK